MLTAAVPCRAYIVYHHGLFAQGVRSVLETRCAVEIVGMERDVARAVKAVQSVRPEVIIVEEWAGKHRPIRLDALLASGIEGSRVVTLSLDHSFATVYDRHRVEATDPAELIRAIRGAGHPHVPGPDQPRPKASMLLKAESDSNGDQGGSARKSTLRRTRTQGTEVSDEPPRTSRGGQKGG